MKELEYPLNTDYILRKKKSIKKKLLSDNSFALKIKIAILGGSTTSEVKNILELFLLNTGIQAEFYESEYNKYFEDAMFGNPDLDSFKPDIVYIHTTNKNITNYPAISDSQEDVNDLLSVEFEKYGSIWKSLTRYGCTIIQNNFELPSVRLLGNLDSYDYRGKTHYINRLNMFFSEQASKIKELVINDINYLSGYLGLEKWYDDSLWYQAKYAHSLVVIPELAFNISKIVGAVVGKTKKCLVLDLDNTCWGGVIGDDGLANIQIGTETPIASAYTAFQLYVKGLKGRGVSLAVCSKNELENAKAGFEHPDSVLTFQDFGSFKANWNPKYQNVEDISKEINIGLDSLVFIDDNPVERDIVKSQIPVVAVPDVGEDISRYIDFVDKNGFFESISLSADDLQRDTYYRQNKLRETETSKYSSYEDFLKSLEMKAEISTFKELYLDRITQLTNKTNQFNLTTKRYTIADIQKIYSDKRYLKLYGKLSDKYGDNGLVSVLIGKIENNICEIELFLMSCRVLKRDMEFAMMDKFMENCKRLDVKTVTGYYSRTQKNDMVSDLFEHMGFDKVESCETSSSWTIDVNSYRVKEKYIEVTNG